MASFVVKVPGINGLGKTEGCEKAGNKVIEKLDEIYSNSQGKIIDKKSLDFEEIHLDNSNLEITNKLIYKNSLEMYGTKERAIFLGGDHSISYSLARGFLEHCKQEKKNPFLIVFDAHPDCMESADSGKSPDEVFPTHEDWLRSLIEAGFPAGNILLIGSRNADEHELEFLKENKINLIPMRFFIEDFQGTCDYITEFSRGAGEDSELYVSLDLDAVDPAFAPATGYCEPGGLTNSEMLYIVQRINKIKNLRAVDIVEINPDKDETGITVKLGAKILSELI